MKHALGRHCGGPGDVDFSQVMPLASGSRTKQMFQPEFFATRA